MPVNHFFDTAPVNPNSEQDLLEDLICEAIQIYGQDVQYIPRESFDELDKLYGEDALSMFSRAYTIEMYLTNVEGFEGGGDMFTKFGLDIKDTTNVVVSRRAFNKALPSNIAVRPKEGDLIYVPLFQKIFEIKFVEKKLNFYSLGKRTPYVYELRCDLFRYSHEPIVTGDAAIDAIMPSVAFTIQLTLGAGTGNFNKGERVYQSADILGTVKSWVPSTKLLQLVDIKGSFSTANTIGMQSGANWSTTSVDTSSDFVDYDSSDNKQARDELDDILDLNDTNPIGTL